MIGEDGKMTLWGLGDPTFMLVSAFSSTLPSQTLIVVTYGNVSIAMSSSRRAMIFLSEQGSSLSIIMEEKRILTPTPLQALWNSW